MDICRTSVGFEAFIDGKSAGYIVLDFDDDDFGDDVVALPSTFTVPEFRGRGVGSALVKAAVDFAESEGLAIDPVCPFVASWLDKHPERTVRVV
ncbi:MAG: GNAT family N-acetyltransferase [Ancrocorticia sp.]